MRVRSLKTARNAVHLSPLAGRGRIALAIRVRGSFRKRGLDCFENSRNVPKHIVVPEPQNSVFVIEKPFVSRCIPHAVSVLPSVDLDGKTSLTADQIDRIPPDRLLPNELMTVKPARSELIPESSFCIRGSSPQTSRTFGLVLGSTAQAETPPHPAGFARRPLPARGERLAPRLCA
jgi:hypothetical protein